MKDAPTAEAMARAAKAAEPEIRYAYHKKSSMVAQWTDSMGWYMVLSLSLLGDWVAMPYEILANGQRVHDQGDWIEVGVSEAGGKIL